PAVADVQDAAVRVDRVQHGRRRAVELAELLLEARLLTDLGVDDDHAQPVLAALGDGAREAVNALALLRREVDGYAVEAALAPQHGQVFGHDAVRGFGARQVLRPAVTQLLERVAEALEPGVA